MAESVGGANDLGHFITARPTPHGTQTSASGPTSAAAASAEMEIHDKVPINVDVHIEYVRCFEFLLITKIMVYLCGFRSTL